MWQTVFHVRYRRAKKFSTLDFRVPIFFHDGFVRAEVLHVGGAEQHSTLDLCVPKSFPRWACRTAFHVGFVRAKQLSTMDLHVPKSFPRCNCACRTVFHIGRTEQPSTVDWCVTVFHLGFWRANQVYTLKSNVFLLHAEILYGFELCVPQSFPHWAYRTAFHVGLVRAEQFSTLDFGAPINLTR